MCEGIALAGSEVPTELIRRWGLSRRLHCREGEPEYWFLYQDRFPKLPIWRDGQLQLARWGNGRGRSRLLPRSGWTWQSTIEQGYWAGLGGERVNIPANLALEQGVWYRVRSGLRGLLVPDERGLAVDYVICEPASHYYRTMTKSDRMPVLIGERI
jgi:hypothetical protein